MTSGERQGVSLEGAKVTISEGLEAGRVLDRLIAEKVMGWELRPTNLVNHDRGVDLRWYPSKNSHWVDTFPDYSSNIAAAWEVVEKFLKENSDDTFLFDVFCIEGDGWCCRFSNGERNIHAEVRKRDSASTAICEAALLFVCSS